jgi:lipid-A-disaccharide synthase
MKKTFIVTGELSGDCTAAWYVKRLQATESDLQIQAVGGDNLRALGVEIFKRFEELNVVGVFEIFRHLPKILRILNELVTHIKMGGFDEVVLVDFPGFNLRLAKKLKSLDPKIKVTYLAPPQLWCWGAWRVNKLKKYCDNLIVLYPFEVEWYKQRGVTAQWLGNPVYDSLQQYFHLAEHKERLIAILPGSRKSEIERFFPLFTAIVKKFTLHHPDVKFVLPLASSLSTDFIHQQLEKSGLKKFSHKLIFTKTENEKFEQLSKCCLAVTKPGTVTLELALLKIPAVMMFKISWLTYVFARPLVKVKYMSLPNLLLDFPLYKELVQSDCKVDLISREIENLYLGFVRKTNDYVMKMKKIDELRRLLVG